MKEIKSLDDINKILGRVEKEKIKKGTEKLKNEIKLDKIQDVELSENTVSSNEILQNKGCKSGFTITNEILEEDKLKSKIFKYISYKKRTESEIRQKFSDVDKNMLDNLIEYFKSQNYINETEYIERSIKEFLAIKNLSIKELTYKKIQKGVNKKLLDNYIVKNREILIKYEIESAKKIILKKSYKMELEDIKKYLFQKGYMSETVSIAIDDTINLI